MSIVSELQDFRYVMGITGASKTKSEDGTVFVEVTLVVQNKDYGRAPNTSAGGDSAASNSANPLVSTQEVHLRLTVPQFYQLLSECEEAKAAVGRLMDQ